MCAGPVEGCYLGGVTYTCAGGGLLFERGLCVLVEGCYLGGVYICVLGLLIGKG